MNLSDEMQKKHSTYINFGVYFQTSVSGGAGAHHYASTSVIRRLGGDHDVGQPV